MNVLSLFDGISCGRVALERAEIKVTKYYASEIDKYAIQVSNKNWPDIVHLGDVTKWKNWDIDWAKIDLLMGGFPCQAWSIAGQQLGDKDPRGALMWDMLDILNHIRALNPKLLFLFENVKMKKEFSEYVNKAIGCEPISLNSSLVSAQNRARSYWTNIPNITQPEDKKIMLRDIVEHGVEAKYKVSAQLLKGFTNKINRRTESNLGFNKCNIRSLDEKCSTLTSRYYKMSLSDPYLMCYPLKDKSQTILSTLHKENEKSMIKRNKIGLLALVGTESEDLAFRKFTPLECERLQTLPDNYTQGISNTQRYRSIGNGWTVDIIKHILQNISKISV